MSILIWVLFGFVAGLVVAAIIYLVTRGGSSPEVEAVEDDTAAQLARAQAKTAVLEDKVREAEEERTKLRASLEAEYQEKLDAAIAEHSEIMDAADAGHRARLEAADSEYQEKLEAAAADCETRLLAAEDEYRAKLATLRAQFDNLESAFAEAQLPDADDSGSAAGAVVAGAAAAAAVGTLSGDDEPDGDLEVTTSEDIVGEEEPLGDGSEEGEFPGSAALAAAAAAVLIADDDEAADEIDEQAVAAIDAELQAVEPVDVDSEAAVSEGSDQLSLSEQERLEAARPEQSSAMVQVAYDLQDKAEEAAHRADEHTAEIVTAALVARSAAASKKKDEPIEEKGSAVTIEQSVDDEFNALPDAAEDYAEPSQEEAAEQGQPGAVDDSEVADVIEREQEAVAAGVAAQKVFEDEETAGAEAHQVEGETDPEMAEQVGEEEPVSADSPWPEDTSKWHGEYFNNVTLEGEPVLVREDAEIDFDWGMGSPAPEINDDNFSVRWTREANLRPGLYRFTVTSDDGARLWVNERLVISAWYDHTEMTFRREMELPGGPVDLRLEYYEKSMMAMVRISWEKIG